MKYLKFFEEIDRITVDVDVRDPEKLASVICSIIDNFGRLRPTFESKILLLRYENFIKKYGERPKDITEELIRSIRNINRHLDMIFGERFVSEEEEIIFDETQKLIIEMVKIYYEFENNVNRYNL